MECEFRKSMPAELQNKRAELGRNITTSTHLCADRHHQAETETDGQNRQNNIGSAARHLIKSLSPCFPTPYMNPKDTVLHTSLRTSYEQKGHLNQSSTKVISATSHPRKQRGAASVSLSLSPDLSPYIYIYVLYMY